MHRDRAVRTVVDGVLLSTRAAAQGTGDAVGSKVAQGRRRVKAAGRVGIDRPSVEARIGAEKALLVALSACYGRSREPLPCARLPARRRAVLHRQAPGPPLDWPRTGSPPARTDRTDAEHDPNVRYPDRKPLRLTLVAGARPNFMKIAPLMRALARHPDTLRVRLVHTGQHYDREMNDVFFEELGIRAPDASLGCGGGSHADQTARIMVALERELLANPADWIVVVGDVNSTLAASVVAKKLCASVAHVEAGLRSGDRSMPEEINRLVTDAITDLFFVTEPSGRANLLREGQPPSRVHFVGHVMVDNLLYQVEQLARGGQSAYPSAALKARLGASSAGYGAVTLHRPSNVDDPRVLRGIASALNAVAAEVPLVFPVHPRTRRHLDEQRIALDARITVLPPLPYMEFLNLWKDARVVVTDSGGLQEESTALGVPCVTVRENTERPVTVDEGTNRLAGTDTARIVAAVREALVAPPSTRRPALWDGRAAVRIADVFAAIATGVPLDAASPRRAG